MGQWYPRGRSGQHNKPSSALLPGCRGRFGDDNERLNAFTSHHHRCLLCRVRVSTDYSHGPDVKRGVKALRRRDRQSPRLFPSATSPRRVPILNDTGGWWRWQQPRCRKHQSRRRFTSSSLFRLYSGRKVIRVLPSSLAEGQRVRCSTHNNSTG